VRVDAVPADRAAECARFAAKLPSSLGDGLTRRRTEPADPHVAAYGDGVVIRCAAPSSTKYRPGDPLFTVNGIAWYADERPAGVVVWSLPKAFVNVEVTMPSGVTGDRLSRLTDAVRAAQPGG
jgi:hypothetical protein